MDKIPEGDYNKIWGQFQLHTMEALSCFNMHGFQDLIPGCAKEITALAELACERVRGNDVPITIDYARKRIGKKRSKKKT